MSKQLDRTTLSQLTSSVEGSLVRTSLSQVKDKALGESVQDCGLSMPESFASYDHNTLSWKTCQHSLFGGLTELASLGYDSEWTCVPASAVGAPHRRRRTFILAYPNGKQEHPLLFAGRYKRSQTPAPSGQVDLVDSHSGGGMEARSSEWLPEPSVGRVVDGVPSRMDRIRVLGNSVVPQVSEWIGRLIMKSA